MIYGIVFNNQVQYIMNTLWNKTSHLNWNVKAHIHYIGLFIGLRHILDKFIPNLVIKGNYAIYLIVSYIYIALYYAFPIAWMWILYLRLVIVVRCNSACINFVIPTGHTTLLRRWINATDIVVTTQFLDIYIFYLAFDQYIYIFKNRYKKNIHNISLKYYIQHWSCCARTGL